MNGLLVLRGLFLSFILALAAIEPAVLILSATSFGHRRHAIAGEWFAVALAIYGVFTLTVPQLIEQPLDCTDDSRLAGSYRTRFFVRLAFAESAALLGFVGFIVTVRGWLYPLGVVFTAVGFVRLAPTRANLATDQEVVRHSGCGLSLVDALATMPPPPRPRDRA